MNPYYSDPACEIWQGDCRDVLKALPDESVNCCVTSPPYWGLRNYGHQDQLGQEPSPEQYVENMRQVFNEVKRVLRADGTLWLNLGDSYNGSGKSRGGGGKGETSGKQRTNGGAYFEGLTPVQVDGCKPKDLIGIPWMVAFALRADGWYLRSDIIWHKPNAMPESITDRPTKAHEYLFLLSKSSRYYYDAEAIRTPATEAMIKQVEEGYNGHATKLFDLNGVQDASATKSRIINGARKRLDKQRGHSRRHAGFNDRWDKLTVAEQRALGANKRSVWTVATACFGDEHFAVFPPDLIKPCILAGCPVGGTVLDPFGGSGTTGAVALELGRRAVLVELNVGYCEMARYRTDVPQGLALT